MKKIYNFLIVMSMLLLSALSLQAQDNCLTFVGPAGVASTSNASLSSTLLTGVSTMTVEAWINVTTYGTAGSHANSIVVQESNGSGSPFLLRCGSNSGTPTLQFIAVVGGTTYTAAGIVTSLIPTGTWHHVAGVVDGSTVAVYVDGVLLNSVAAVGSFTPTNTGVAIRIGNDYGYTDRPFVGKIDEVRIWNSAVSPNTLYTWYDKTIQTCHASYANLLAYFQMDDISNPAVLKATVGADGTVTNTSYVATSNALFQGTVTSPKVTAGTASTAITPQNSTNKEVIRIAVQPFGTMDLTQLVLRTDGTTNYATDITNAKIWSTGTSPVFATGTQFGSTIGSPPAPGNDMTFDGTYSMTGCSTYYFWLTYDITPSATQGNFVDGILQSAVVNGSTLTPIVSNPSGNRLISNSFDVTIGTGTSTTYYVPMVGYYTTSYGYSYTQQIYLSSEFASGGANGTNVITKIRYYCATAQTYTNFKDWVIYMGNTSKSTFANGSDWVPVSSLTQVFNGVIPQPVSGQWMEITLTTPFVLTAGSNLVIAVDENTPGYPSAAVYWRYTSPGGVRTLYRYTNTAGGDILPTNPGTMTTTSTYRNNMQFVVQPAPAMTFSSATTTQASTADALPASTNQAILGVQVVTAGYTNPLALTQLSIQLSGTDPTVDVSKIHVYYTGTSNTFATTAAFDGSGTTVAGGTINIDGSQTLANGTNYFWIAYDINPSATTGNTVDALLLASPTATIVVGGTGQPVTVNDPAGSRTLVCPGAPSITTQPTSQTIAGGGTATFTVVAGNGAAYQWQESPDAGVNWNPLSNGGVYSGVTSTSLVLTSPTFSMNGYRYRCIVTGCIAPTATTDGTASLTINYCTNTGTNSTYYINNFRTTGAILNITNNGTGYSTSGYGNYTAMTAGQAPGSSVGFYVSVNSSTSGFGLWVDWNQNGSFADAGEQMYMTTGYVSSVTNSFIVPLTALGGPTRMRVVQNDGSISPTACNGSTYTECEDYTFIVMTTPMSFASATVTQASTADLLGGATNQAILGIQVVTAGYISPIALTQISMQVAGNDPTVDISKIHVYYTGTSPTFATTNAFDGAGTTVTAGTITIDGSRTLTYGTNYFWIAYDISPTATTGDTVDALLLASPTTTLVVGGTAQTVTVNDPAGSRTITCPGPPSITSQPTSQTISGGGTATFTVVASNGASYQWEESPDGTIWNPLSNGGFYSGVTSTSLVLTSPLVSKNGYKYRCIVTGCIAPTDTTDGLASLTINYCTNTGGASSYYINNFSTTGGVTNITNNASGFTTGGYGNFTAMSASQYPTQTVSFSITGGGTNTYGFGIWIDWNQNGSFADAGEQVYASGTSYVNSGSGNFIVPVTALTGSTRMRVVSNYLSTSPTACTGTAYTECEDYTFNVAIPPAPTITSLGSTSGCIGTNLTINGTSFIGVSASGVTIGSTPVTAIVSNTGTVMVVTVGAGTTGTVSVTALGGTVVGIDVFTVYPLPVISGNGCLFVGTDLTLTATPTGGSWLSGTPAVATIDVSSGYVSGITSGLSTITYTEPINSCSNTVSAIVYPAGTGTVAPLSQTICTTAIATPIVVSGLSTGVASLVNSSLASAPPNTTVLGGTSTPTPTYTGGVLQMYTNTTSQVTEMIINNPNNLNSSTFTASVDINLYPTGGADGLSFNYGAGIPQTSTDLQTANTNGLENGVGTGLSICLKSYSTNQILVKYNGTQVGSTVSATINAASGTYKTLLVSVNASNQVSVTYGGTAIFTNLALPAAYGTANKSTWQFAIASRSGGTSEGCNLKNLSISLNNAVNYEYSFNGGSTYQSSASYTPPSTTATYHVYYRPIGSNCPLSADSSTVTGISDITVITGSSLAAQSVCYNETFLPISVTATGYNLTYQWYLNTIASNTGGTSLGSANGAQTDTYTPQSTLNGVYYYYCVVHSFCGADQTTPVSGAFTVNPNAQPTALVLTPDSTSVSGSFTVPTTGADNYLVVRSTSPTFGATLPVNGTTYIPGDLIGANTVVALTTGNTFIDNGPLAMGTQYFYYVFAANSACTSGISYLTANPLSDYAITLSGLACITPTNLPTGLTFTTTTSTITGTFIGTTPNTDYYLVVRSTSPTLSAGPVDQVTYAANDTIGGGNVVSYQIGSIFTFTDIGLTAGTQYYYFVYSVSTFCVGGPLYSLTSLDNNIYTNCIAPLAQPIALTFPATTYTTIDGSFTASATADHYLIVRNTTGTTPTAPVNTTNYTPYVSTLGAGNLVIAYQTSTAFTDTSLTPATHYYYYIYGANSVCSNGPVYRTASPLTNNVFTNCPAPTAQPTALVLTASGATTINGSFTAASPATDRYLIVRSTSPSLGATPVDLTTYAAGNGIGTGFVVAYQAGTTFANTGLTAGTDYYYFIFSATSVCPSGPIYQPLNPLTGAYATGIYTTVPIANLDVDVVINGAGTSNSSSTTDCDGANYTFVTNDWNPGAGVCATTGNTYPVAGGTITSLASPGPAIDYTVQSATGNNAYQVAASGNGTLTFTTPIKARNLYMLYLHSTGSTYNLPMVQVNFSDGSNQQFANSKAVYNWCTAGSTQATGVYNRTTRNALTTCTTPTTCQYLQQMSLPIDVANQQKLITGITFTNGTGKMTIFALSRWDVTPPCVTPVAQPTALVLTPSALTVSGSFTASANTDHYLVVRGDDANAPTPVDLTTYTAGDVITGTYTGTVVGYQLGTTFTDNGPLTPGILYNYFVYAANSFCGGGPLYNAINPLTNSTTTICDYASIVTQPQNATVAVSGNGIATFTVVDNLASVSWMWEVSTDNGDTWSTVSDGGEYSNATTASLKITNPTWLFNGYRYRCTINGCQDDPKTTDGLATLIVTGTLAAPAQALGNITVGPSVDAETASGTALLPDANITASSYFNGTSPDISDPFRGRVFNAYGSTGNVGWGPATDTMGYLQFDLGSVKTVFGVATQGRGSYRVGMANDVENHWVLTYNVEVSTDGSTWNTVPGGPFTGNTNKNGLVTQTFAAPVYAQYVKFVPVTRSTYVGLRAEVICQPTTTPADINFSAELLSGATTLKWYDAAISGTLLGTGLYYVAPGQTTTTTVYAESFDPITGNYSATRKQVIGYIATPVTFDSSTASQASIANVKQNDPDREILGLQIVTSGNGVPIPLTEIQMQLAGTNPSYDVAKIHVYYTGASNTFATTNEFVSGGTTVINGTTDYTINGTRTLAIGNNYFWIAYDISPTATVGHTVDAKFLSTASITVDGIQQLVIDYDPIGERIIDTCFAPDIVSQPVDQTVSPGAGVATFATSTTVINPTYQWQEYNGTIWNNITNGGVYSGATTNTLTLTNPLATLNGYKYRCAISYFSCATSFTDGLATLTIPCPTLTATITPLSQTICGSGVPQNINVVPQGTTNWINSPLTSLPANTVLFGDSYSWPGSYLQLHANTTGQFGAFYVNNPGSVNNSAFTVSFEVNMYTTGGADGLAFNYAGDLPTTLTALKSFVANGSTPPDNNGGIEEGSTNTGLVFQMQTYGPKLMIKFGAVTYSAVSTLDMRGADGVFKKVTISVNYLNQMSVTIDGVAVFTNIQLPAAYASADKSTWQMGLAGRSGGLAQGCRIKNLSITSQQVPYYYSFDGGTTFQTANYFVPPAVSATYNVVLRDNTTMCSDTVGSSVVDFQPLPTITGTFIACVGESIQLTGSGTKATVNPWVSSLPAVATVDTNGLVTGIYPGYTNITYTNSYGCSTSVEVYVNSIATVAIVPSTNTLCGNQIQHLTKIGTANPDVTQYTFAASNGTFVPINGLSGAAGIPGDAGYFSPTPIDIGFTFKYEGVAYTSFKYSGYGFITLNTAMTNTSTNDLAGATPLVIAPLWDYHTGNWVGSGGYRISGPVGSRIMTAQWLNYAWGGGSQNSISFQVMLYEADGRIDFVYRPEGMAAVSPAASIGISGATTGKFLSLNGTGTSPTASTTTSTNNLSVKPAAGQVYTFIPPVTALLWSSPNNHLYTDAGALTPYTPGTPLYEVWAKPTTTTIYTATAVNMAGCAGSATANITVNAVSVAPTDITGITDICVGNQTTLTANNGELGTNGSMDWYKGSSLIAFVEQWNTQPYTSTYGTQVNSTTGGILDVSSTAVGPYIDMFALNGATGYDPATYKYIQMRYKVLQSGNAAGNGSITFLNTLYFNPDVNQQVDFPMISDDNWHIVNVDMSVNPTWIPLHGNITGWRYQWALANGSNVLIDYIKLGAGEAVDNGTTTYTTPIDLTPGIYNYNVTISSTCNTTSPVSTAVTVNDIVGTPVFTLGSISSRCSKAETVIYGATAANTTGITYTLDTTSLTAGCTIDANTGAVTYVASYWGTSIITVTAAGCPVPLTATHTVTINETPSVVTVTPSTKAMCSIDIQELVASGGTSTNGVISTIYTQDFNGTATGWTTVNNSSGGNSTEAAWTLRPGSYYYSNLGYTFNSNDTSQFYLSNSDAQGGGTTATILTSPSFSTEGYTTASVSFWHNFYSGTVLTATVEYSINGTDWYAIPGLTWLPGSDRGTPGGFVQDNASLPAAAIDKPAVQVRFRLDGEYGLHWALDNVKVEGNTTLNNITWSPLGGLYTDPGAGIGTEYTGDATTTVYAKPVTAGLHTYIATATTLSGCISSGTAEITVTTLPVATFSYTGSPYCSIAADPLPTFDPNVIPGTFSFDPTGLSINTASGLVDLDASTAGNYTLTYTIDPIGGCPQQVGYNNITITTAPTATISYAGTPYCTTVTSAPVTIGGTGVYTGGTFTSTPAGMSIDGISGEVNPSLSLAGTYDVTYTIPAFGGGCGPIDVTTTITITQLPIAGFSYTGSPYCSNSSNPLPTFDLGGEAGIFTVTPTDLLFVSNTTGEVNISGSSAASYTITNTIAAANGCAEVIATSPFVLNTQPVVNSISYIGSPWFTTAGVQVVTLSGDPGGTYTSTPAGLAIDSITGDITPSGSIANTYTVTYTAVADGCTDAFATTSVTIIAFKTLNVTVLIEGLYVGGGLMHEAYDYDDVLGLVEKWGTGIADTVTVELYDDTYTFVARYPGVYLNINGLLTIPTVNASLGNDYYITIFHRNSMPITTATAQSFAGTTINYNFTTPANQAYGVGSQKALVGGLYGMYTGELDHDTYYFIDGDDNTIMEPAVILSALGYLLEDLNGSGYVDGDDNVIMEPNVIISPYFQNPLTAKKKLAPIILNK